MEHLSQPSMVIGILINALNGKINDNKGGVVFMSQRNNKIGRGTLILSLTSFLFFLVLQYGLFLNMEHGGFTIGTTTTDAY